MKNLLSIIIPVWNAQKHLRSCLRSIDSQYVNGGDIEVLIIDDGSTDDSVLIIREWTAFPITLISQRNQGVSSARNNGLSRAKGKYIWFIDSDDWLEPHALAKILKSLELNKSCYQIGFARNDGINKNHKKNSVISTTGKLFLLNNGAIPTWSIIFRKEISKKFNIIYDDSLNIHEDCDFNFRILYWASEVMAISGIHYNYLINNELSATDRNKLNGPESYLKIIDKIFTYGIDNGDLNFCLAYSKILFYNALDELIKVEQNYGRSVVLSLRRAAALLMEDKSLRHKAFISGCCYLPKTSIFVYAKMKRWRLL